MEKYILWTPLALFAIWIFYKLIRGMWTNKSTTLGLNSRKVLSSYINVSLPLSGGHIAPNIAFPVLAQIQNPQSLDVCVGLKSVSKRTKNVWRFKEAQTIVRSFSLLIGTDNQCEILLETTPIDDTALFTDAIVQAVNFEGAEVSVKCKIQITAQSQQADSCHTAISETGVLSYVDGSLKLKFLPVALFISINLDQDKIYKICDMAGNSSLMRNA